MDSANAASGDSRPKASSLGQRVLTAAVGVPVLALLIWFGFWPVTLVVITGTCLSLLELYQAFQRGGFVPRIAIGLTCGLLLCLAAASQALTGTDRMGVALALGILISLTGELAQHSREGGLAAWGLTFAGALYVAGLLSHYILIGSLDTPLLADGWLVPLGAQSGPAWIYTVLAITWLQDTGAFFAGRSFGRHHMAPYLSPKKTWEGAVGGLLASIVVALFCKALFGLPVSNVAMVILGLAGAISGLLGDLAESFIKRQVNVKDLGNFFPGHGGFLDRIDSILFSGAFLYYLILLFTNQLF
jgi:CDP-diglyceride synthetase